MPPPSTPHRPSNRGGSPRASPTKQKPLDIGVPLGIYDTNSVREKVRKWQQQGGGVITADDVVYYEDDGENSTVEATPRTPKADKPAPSPTRKRSKSTPRKRVISDEHWKLNRTPTQSTVSQKLPPPKRFSQYTTNESLASPRAGRHEQSRKEEKSRSLPPPSSLDSRERRKSRVLKETLDSLVESKGGEDDTSHYGSSKSTSRPVSAGKPGIGAASELSDSAAKTDLPADEENEWAASDADFSELSRRRARGAPQPAPKPRGPVKPPKGGIFEHMLGESKKVFAKAEPPKPTGNRGSKIEAWLSGTSDPFFDSVVDPEVEVPAPLKMRVNRGKREESDHKTIHEGDNGAHRTPSGKPTGRRRVKSREFHGERVKSSTQKPGTKESGRDISSSSSRKRSSEQRHSRSSSSAKEDAPREKSFKEKDTMSDTETAPFSDGSEVSGNNAPVPLSRKRPFPSTGVHRLSTIASMESMEASSDTRSSQQTDIQPEKRTLESSEVKEAPEERDQFDPNSLPVVSSQLKRRLTTHDDLISVLSAPNSRSRSIRSARSIRTNRSRLTNATIPDLLKELSADEVKYMRELKTLVGGVIPVLLTCVLSKSDSAIAAGLFRPSMDPKDELNFTKPIVDMGVAVERLKTLHKRIPQEDTEALLTWAFGAQRVYREYLKAWRLGFKDVIVNLAPLEEEEKGDSAETKSLDEGMARDENGDIVDSDGEKVDVAYLLKRPLVRLKYLAKTFKGINLLQPSDKAEEIAAAYQNLVTDARRRARDERARLEDESAACIDSTRARDPATLGPIGDISIDKTRRVRARDFFNLSLYHSTGQVIDCRAELLLRDNSDGSTGGDLLICEIDHTDRWLLFPPMDLSCASARNGDTKGEIVVMLRSSPDQTKPWQELLLLKIEEEDVGFEWVQMLGLDPIPPTVSRSQSFIERAKQRQRARTITSAADYAPETPPSPTSVDVPLGERATSRTLRRSSPREPLSDPSIVGSSLASESRISANTAITPESDYASATEQQAKASPRPQSQILHSRDPRKSMTSADKSPGLKRSKAKRVARHDDDATPSPHSKEPTPGRDIPVPTTPRQEHDEAKKGEKSSQKPKEQYTPKTPSRDSPEQSSPRVSSVPSMDLPIIPKLRQGDSQSYIAESIPPTSDESDEEFGYLESSMLSDRPTKRKSHSRSNSDTSDKTNGDEAPPPPPHSRSPSSTGSSLNSTPVLGPTGLRPRRRGSSPLKHEYEPSTASDSISDSDTSTVRRYDLYSESEYSESDSSEESEDELSSIAPVKVNGHARTATQASVVTSASSLSPSNSASQGGYRSVPSQPTKSSTALASVFAWSDKGTWETIFPDDCRVIVSPGLIEAYQLSAAPIGEDGIPTKKGRPLIALELTPLVPIRRGTAIDISIRSPPTERSKIAWSNNIMFRSANADDCEALYGLINQARINNPTYIALQNARGPFADQTVPIEQPNKSTGWFGWPRRRKSYRASASPRSLADNSESSVGTMSSAFSALKRFGAGGSKMFSISRSSVTSRSRQKEDSLYSSSAASGTNFMSNSGIGRIAAAIKNADGIGLSNAKIRLYMRETPSKWRDMGAARLTIMPVAPEPARPDTAVSGRSDPSSAVEGDNESPPASGTVSPRRAVDSKKRILVRGKTRGEVLLDVCLGESSFERVARTGIAVSVREENEGGAMPKKGGVTVGSNTIYMIQMKSEAEAAYTFGLVGKLRY
ncbi:hypothetical protein BDV59DRAFT_172926 [Aspergillus ambiguus]|uniref:uncharacterized protein n=1 Tax=Aspergillus ambiguus TaxID=176160 RepID=UPI003CCD6D88